MQLVQQRLFAQRLDRFVETSVRDLVVHLLAVQAQDWAASMWAIALRLPQATAKTVESAVDTGAVIRIHAFRYTWQLIAPQDVRWILGLVGERLLARAARRHADLGIDAATIKKSNAAIVGALADGEHRTRAELKAVLERAKVSTEGQRLPHLLGIAEIHQLICSGSRKGKQPTWTLFDQRIPTERKALDRNAALTELARRYFESRGPATLDDFRWWSGLDTADARRGLEGAKPTLSSSTIERGKQERSLYASASPLSKRATTTTSTHLIPAFDEYLVAYKDRSDVLAPEHVKLVNAGGGLLGPCVVHHGRVVGTWRKVIGRRGSLEVSHELFPSIAAVPKRAIAKATERYATFLETEL